MTDPLRSDRSSSGDTPDRGRDARIEELLLTGLDHYFGGQHELAISVWTRVLFLDRAHGKARAYIERARGAVAEKQREAEELLHRGAAALHRGDRTAARQLLTSAAERDTSGEEALALLNRLDRLEAATPAVTRSNSRVPPSRAEHRPTAAAAGRRDSRLAWVVTGIVTGILLAAVGGGYLSMVADPFELSSVRTATPATVEEPLSVPAGCEVRLLRARALVGEGKLHEALDLLEPGDSDDVHRAAFDELRTAIQRQLLEAGRRGAGFSTTDARDRSRSPKPPPRSPALMQK